MSKNKLQKFTENESFNNLFQPSYDEVLNKDFSYKGRWSEYFGNNNPIILELGCGKGEYTIALAERAPRNNYIGVDIKGARLWKGAKYAFENKLNNVAFIRTRIEFINSFFDNNEVDQVWLTFPDPQEKKRRKKKRLTSPGFLSRYQQFLKDNAILHLKTDNDILYNYTKELVNYNELTVISDMPDVYYTDPLFEALDIKTFYEQQFIDEGKTIKYIAFRLPRNKTIQKHEGAI